uniref:Retrovirus-related Pol polyprotein from transposon 297 family n=1 Tax=Cajanus cajan TaxID=3821 RepID=A0A151U2P9_CAJCA|nr:Retrovirus-related Pol polyprotein from transposon 297 family [Cajanus cajan]
MPFGLTNAPASFQALMNQIFQDFLRKFVLVFFDDILIYSASWSAHLQHLQQVLSIMQEHQLHAKLSKCAFGTQQIAYLGHMVSSSGAHMDPDKVQSVLQWPTPTTLKQLRGFLGLTSYYRRFIKGYASLASPLHDLLKKDAFLWSDTTQVAFDNLKRAMTQAPVLVLPNFSIPFELETDASGVGIGAILNKPDKQNVGADALSRVDCFALSMQHCDFLPTLKAQIAVDSEYNRILFGIRAGKSFLYYREQDGLLFWKDRLVIPKQSPLTLKLIQEFHDSPIGGHAGYLRTYQRLLVQFYWHGMKQQVYDYVRQCQVCQQAKVSHFLPGGLLQPLPIPERIWDDIAMDFITGLPLVNGYTVIMVVVDRLSKYAHLIPLKTHFTSNIVAEQFIQHVVKLHGIPKSIVSDRDKTFTSNFWQHLFKYQGTTLAMSTVYHPQTDGQSEALNRCIEMYCNDPP